uniref:Uncharacterized protein n=1 Tax=Rhizophora mucronata TaxID=61149 RepID=A0A2P2JJ70_RHIMU
MFQGKGIILFAQS